MAPADALLQRIAASTEGFAGADLQALCTAAVMAAVTRSCPHLVDQLCYTATTGLHPDPVSQSSWKSDHHQQQQQQQPGVQQQQRHQQQPENQKQEQQQPDKQQEPLEAKQQDKQQEPLQQQQQQGACGQQQSSRQQQNSPQQHGQQQYQQPRDGDDGADRMHCGNQVMQAARQNQQQQQDKGDVLQRRDLSPQANQQKQNHDTDEASEKLDKKLLTKLRVKAVDWRTALAAAPLPCSARQSISALSSGHAKALPHHLVPLLLPCISRACQCIAAAQLPWEGTTATALEACAAAAGTPRGAAAAVADEAEAEVATTDTLERLLAELGAVEGLPSGQAGKS